MDSHQVRRPPAVGNQYPLQSEQLQEQYLQKPGGNYKKKIGNSSNRQSGRGEANLSSASGTARDYHGKGGNGNHTSLGFQSVPLSPKYGQTRKGSKANNSQLKGALHSSMLDPVTSPQVNSSLEQSYNGDATPQEFYNIKGARTSMAHGPSNGQNKSWGIKTQYPAGQGRFNSVNMMSTTLGATTTGSNSDRKLYASPNNNKTTTLDAISSIHPHHFGSESERRFAEGLSLKMIKRSRKLIQEDVLKMHNRIRMLQLEEERALKKIDETRKKAKRILEVRLTKQERTRQLSPTDRALTPDARTSVFFERKVEHQRVLQHRLQSLMERKQNDASQIKRERRHILKKKLQIEKAYMKTNQLRRIEIQEDAKMGLDRIELSKKRKIEENLRHKEQEAVSEARMIKRQEKQARRLEMAEAEILQRLKETHQQQREAIQDIEKILKSSTGGGSIMPIPAGASKPSLRMLNNSSVLLSNETLVAVGGSDLQRNQIGVVSPPRRNRAGREYTRVPTNGQVI